jgi:uncharacterized membrane protein HdeD (DUF308 family)
MAQGSFSLSSAGRAQMDPAMSAALARNWWAVALRGVAAILFGLIALFMPVAAMLSLALLFAVYLVADGVFGIIAAVRAAQSHERWGLLLGEGLLDLVMGIIVFMFPGGAVLGFVLVTAVWALMTGGLMLTSSFRLHGSHGRVWLALGGIVSLIWGVLLILAPLIGAVVLTWWLGLYALAFGIMLLVLGLRLRGRHVAGGAAPMPA